MHSALTILTYPFILLGKIFTALFGHVKWSMPPWLAYVVDMAKHSFLKFALCIGLVIALLVLCVKAYHYYSNLPQPILVDAIISVPQLNIEQDNTLGAEQSIPPLIIEFGYTQQSPPPMLPQPPMPYEQSPRRLQTSMPMQYPSVAPLDLIGSAVTAGINLRPNKAGTWRWQDDRTLTFTPQTPWPAGEEYEISFASSVFDTQDKFTNDEFSFTTLPLVGEIAASEFELSVEDKLKQVYIEIEFNYPVEAQSVQQALVMAYQKQDGEVGPALDFTFSISEDLYSASAIFPIAALPDESRIMDIRLNKGIKSIYGGQATANAVQTKIVIPDVYSYLKLEESTIDILRDPQNEPDQFVLLSFTDAISRDELLDKFSLYLLPNTENDAANAANNSRQKYWQSPREISANVLQNAQKLDYVLMPNASNNSKNYQIKIDVAPGRQLYLRVKEGLTSANGFVQRAFFDQILMAPQYPQEVVITGEGSVITHSNDQRLAFSTRGIRDVQVSVGKVIDDELYHLVSQTQGDISQPTFDNWRFNENNLATFTTQYISMNSRAGDVKSAAYASVDLNALVADGLGLFFVEIKGWDKKNDRELYNVSDKLLVLVTDMGVIVKTSQNQSQDVFVQSIQSGKPVAGAVVELIAKNGTALFRKITDSEGHVTFPSASDFQNAQEPVVYVIKQDGDVSFIPYNRFTRQINYSRFNVGGEYTYGDAADRVNAYMFTDRGIYRPGETVNIGMIVKGEGLEALDNIPLELVVRDAQYNEVYVEKISLPEFGFTDAKFNTQRSFNTGSYSATLHLVRNDDRQRNSVRASQIGSLNFDVEEFQADTLSIVSQIDGLPTKGWAITPALINEVTLSNLFGVPAQNRTITSTLTLRPMAFSFDEFADITFYSPTLASDAQGGLQSVNEELPTQITNADGKANVNIDLSRFTKGTYALNVQTRGFEASGGRSVGTSARLLYSPSRYLLGHKASGNLDFINLNSERNLTLLAIDNTLTPIALNDLNMRISKVQNISTLVKQYNGRYQYESIEKYDVLSEESFSLPAGSDTLTLNTSEAGTYVLEVLTASGDVVSSVKYTVVGESNNSAQLDKNAELKVVLNKSDYQPGELIELSISAPYAGSGLISIESDEVHTFKWFTSSTSSSVQSIVIPESIEGNAYINVAFVRNVASKEIFTSPLSYAVVPFSIDQSQRTLDISLAVEDIVQPGKPMSITLNVPKDAKVAVFAVDVGILQVANYRTPNPLAHFFKKRALNVRTMQILDLILPDFALTQMLSAAGGDVEADMVRAEMAMAAGASMKRSSNPFERKVQDPAVFWSGVVNAKKGANTYTFDVPNDFAGALSVMAIAVGENAIGRTQENTIVRGPFVLSPNVLNQAAPGDEFEVTLSVANVVKDSPIDAKVNISVAASEHISIVGNNTAQLSLSENQEDAVRFSVKANEVLGGASINFNVNMTDASGKTWQSSRTATLSVRPAMPYEVNITTGAANNGMVSLQTPIPLFSQQSSQLLRASVSPLVIGEGLSAYLDEYPHGCTEQMVSRVFGLIGLSTLATYGPSTEKVNTYFTELIAKLAQRQSYAGGFSYWPSDQQNDVDTSIYVLHFLIEANALGFAVPQDMLQSGLRYLTQTAEQYFAANTQNKSSSLSLRNLRQRAKLIYLLTRSGTVTSNLLIDLVNTLDKQHKSTWKKDITSAYIAASYHLLQQTEQANQLIQAYDLQDESLLINQAFAGLAPRITIDAQYLFLVAKHFAPRLNAVSQQAVLNITQAIYKGEYNTISAAYSMLALGAYHSALNLPGGSSASTLENIDKQITFSASILKQDAPQQLPLVVNYTPFASAAYPIGTQSVEAALSSNSFANQANYDRLYYVNMQAGYQKQLPVNAISNGIEVQKSFLNKQGEVATIFKQGDEVTLRLRIRTTTQDTIANVAIVDLLPGGFEVIRESLQRTARPWQSDYIDIREDRVVIYKDVSKRVSEISYKVVATAAGTFTAPPSFAEAMYDRSVTAYSASSTLVVEAQ